MANQKSLTAFFGSGKTKASDKVLTKQGSLKAAFQKGETNKQKENVVNDKATVEKETTTKADDADLMDTDDEMDVKPAAAAAAAADQPSAKTYTSLESKATKSKSKVDKSKNDKPSKPDVNPPTKSDNGGKSKKRVIEESDDSEADDVQPIAKLKSSENTSEKMDDENYDDEDSEEELEADSEDEPEDETKSAPKKKQKTLTGKTVVKKTGSKSATTAAAMKSNAQLDKMLKNHMSNDEAWKDNKPLPYSALCDVFGVIEGISSRLDIQEALTELFRLVLLRDGGGDDSGGDTTATNTKAEKQSDMYSLIYLASNSVAPSYECVELGVGDSILIKAIGEASGTAPNMIKKKYEKEGDLGTVAQTSKGKQKTLVGFGRMAGPKRLEAREVLKVFREIATTSGSQSQKWKVDKIKGLLVRAKGLEPKYIIRGLQGKLRIGLAQSTVLVALAHAVTLTRPREVTPLTEERIKEIRAMDDEEEYPDLARELCVKNIALDAKLDTATKIVKKAYSEVPSYDILLDALLSSPLQELHKTCNLTPGVPVVPMLAKPTKSVAEVLKRLDGQRFTCEYKYDGERAQVHQTPDGTTKVFSRNLLNTSEKFPEVPLYVKEACKDETVTSFVLDTEVVAFNRETKQFVPFQVLSTRKRTEESAESAKVQVIVQAFDLMYLNGKSLLDCTLSERRELLRKNFVPIDGKFQFATSLDHNENGDTGVLEEFLDEAVKGQCEGLMVKTLDTNAQYQPSRRSLNWLKLKKDYLEGLGDSVSRVVVVESVKDFIRDPAQCIYDCNIPPG